MISSLTGEVIRACRKQRGLSIRCASSRAQISADHWGNIESGKAALRVRTFAKMAQGLGMEPASLMAAIEKQLGKEPHPYWELLQMLL